MGKSTRQFRTTHQPSRKDTTTMNELTRRRRIIGLAAAGTLASLLAITTACTVTARMNEAVDHMPTMVDERITPKPTPTPTVDLPVDEWNGVPECTDAIADAGGVCHGEPTSEPVGELAAVKVSAPVAVAPTPPADLPPCKEEDSDNCYWDAATMGNGIGRSFVRLHDVTYYADQPARTVTLNGVTLEYVDGSDAILYCDQPLEVGIDVDDNGNQWAGCM